MRGIRPSNSAAPDTGKSGGRILGLLSTALLEGWAHFLQNPSEPSARDMMLGIGFPDGLPKGLLRSLIRSVQRIRYPPLHFFFRERRLRCWRFRLEQLVGLPGSNFRPIQHRRIPLCLGPFQMVGRAGLVIEPAASPGHRRKQLTPSILSYALRITIIIHFRSRRGPPRNRGSARGMSACRPASLSPSSR